ncbi:hypothetical protein ACWCXL_12225 [Streptomyces sp. NPDC001588]
MAEDPATAQAPHDQQNDDWSGTVRRRLTEELAGAQATIDHMARAMSWLGGHDRQGLDHLNEAQYEARARMAAVKQARQWAARARAAERALNRVYRGNNELVVYRWVCPYCENGDMGQAQGRCVHCHGVGLTNDVAGWDEAELTPAPVPPGVMRRACTDCAFRSGSPELEANGETLPIDAPFWCHHGCAKGYGGSYQPLGSYRPDGAKRDIPLGEQICAGWWALKTGRPLPKEPFREPGTSPETDDSARDCSELAHPDSSAQLSVNSDPDETRYGTGAVSP